MGIPTDRVPIIDVRGRLLLGFDRRASRRCWGSPHEGGRARPPRIALALWSRGRWWHLWRPRARPRRGSSISTPGPPRAVRRLGDHAEYARLLRPHAGPAWVRPRVEATHVRSVRAASLQVFNSSGAARDADPVPARDGGRHPASVTPSGFPTGRARASLKPEVAGGCGFGNAGTGEPAAHRQPGLGQGDRGPWHRRLRVLPQPLHRGRGTRRCSATTTSSAADVGELIAGALVRGYHVIGLGTLTSTWVLIHLLRNPGRVPNLTAMGSAGKARLRPTRSALRSA